VRQRRSTRLKSWATVSGDAPIGDDLEHDDMDHLGNGDCGREIEDEGGDLDLDGDAITEL
jgi:hypothetical protein